MFESMRIQVEVITITDNMKFRKYSRKIGGMTEFKLIKMDASEKEVKETILEIDRKLFERMQNFDLLLDECEKKARKNN